MYKKKLIALLEGLEGTNIDKLIEQSPEFLKELGATITRYAKEGILSEFLIKD